MAPGAPDRPEARVSNGALAPGLETACRRWAEQPAITYRGSTITYAELWRQVTSLASCYQDFGVRPGDRILCGLRNCPETIVAMNAAWLCGAIHIGVDEDLTAPELSWLVGHTEAAVLIVHPGPGQPEPLAPLQAVAHSHPSTLRLVHEGNPGEGELRFADLLGRAETSSATFDLPRSEDTALLFLTSGTTGRPKGVMETLPVCWAKMQFFADAYTPGTDDVHLVYLPMSHVFGLRLALIALLSGGRLVLQERFSPAGALDLVSEHAVTVLPGMPTHLTLLLNKLDPARHQVASLRWVISAAAGLPRPLVEAVYERLPVELLYVFGCSEGFTMQTTDRAEILRGSVGSSIFRGPPGTSADGSVTILDPSQNRSLPCGEVGEIAFGAAVPVRYWRAPDVATDGWYRTGDLGRIDEQGCVYVLGRLKELVNRGGLKVSPAEVEAAIVRHPQVRDGAVIPTPDPVLGEATCACVVADEGTITLAGLRTFLEPTLARHKLPDELCRVGSIPRSPIGKVDRPALQAMVGGDGVTRERLRPR